MSRATSFWFQAVLVGFFLCSSTAPSSLYDVYQRDWHFSASMLTTIFAVYAGTLLATLLATGSLSDLLGRRPVVVAALAANAVAAVLFLSADGVWPLVAARALQGVAMGLASGPLSAGLIETQRFGDATSAALINTVARSGGSAVAGLGVGALVQYGPAPTHTVYWVIIATSAIAAVGILLMPEPSSRSRRPRAWASLRPTVAFPADVRAASATMLPCLIALWALCGLYLSLAPSLIEQLFHSSSPMWGGLVICLMTGIGAGPSIALRRAEPAAMTMWGCVAILIGVGLSAWGIAMTNGPLFLVGSGLAGLGLGPAFVGTFGALTGLGKPDTRAGLISMIYLISYLAFSIPVLIAGVVAGHIGLRTTGLLYAFGVATLVALTATRLFRANAGPKAPPDSSVHAAGSLLRQGLTSHSLPGQQNQHRCDPKQFTIRDAGSATNH